MRATRQFTRAMSKPAKVHQSAAKYFLRCVAGTTYLHNCLLKKRVFNRTAFSDSNCCNNRGKRQVYFLLRQINLHGSVGFMSGVQSLTAMSTREANLVAFALQSALCPLNTCDKRKQLTFHSHKSSPSRSSLAARKLLELLPYPATTMESFSVIATPSTRSSASVPFCE